MKLADDQPSGLTALDRPNSYIGRSVPRPNLARLTQRRGQYVTDVVLPRMVHVAFVRSPYAHARIKSIATAHAVAVERSCWQGEAVCAVVARARAGGEDGCALVEVDYEVLPSVTDAQ